MLENSEDDRTTRISILLSQYEVCAGHHLGFYSLIWQVPAVAITIGGGLATIVFSTSMPLTVRILLLLVGATFMASMTISLERFRMFQMRRRKDLQQIEEDLKECGCRHLQWGGDEIAEQIRSGELSKKGIILYRFEGFQVLRGMMYLITGALILFSVLTIISA